MSNIVKSYPKLLRSASPWQLSQDLLQLFDALFIQNISLPDTEAEMHAFLTKAYQVDKQKFAALDFEANIIITLWQAWQHELSDRNLIDEKTLYSYQLMQHINTVNTQQHWYILFLNDAFSTIEIEWLHAITQKSHTNLISPNIQNFKTDRSRFIYHALYSDSDNNKALQKPTNTNIGLLACNSFENEAQQILQQCRYFYSIKQEHESIVLLCEDRSLVRRLRALLEQYDISLVDPFGWSLITTRAATFINAMLECAEQNYPYTALLEIIKSPFTNDIIDMNSAYRFEHDIVRSENIHTDITAYKRALNKRSRKLGAWSQQEKIKLETSLNDIEAACTPIRDAISATSIDINSLINAILFSLKHMQAFEHLYADAAGKVLIDTLHKMQATAKKFCYKLSLNDYKAWLLHEMSNNYLINRETSDDISLVNLKQSQGFSADYLIVASANRQKLPNLKNNLQFFNQRVCHELGLPTYKDNLLLHKNWFFELLVRSKQCVFSWQAEKEGELQLPSTWITAISNLHDKTFNQPLANLYNSIETIKPDINFKTAKLASTVKNYRHLLPKDISVSAHQTLIDCPYEFFVSRLLNLKTTDDIKQQLQKNDFGSLVHQAIQAFHSDIDFLPGPFTLPINQDNRSHAISLLKKISIQVFSSHISDRYQDNSWLTNWLNFIPTFIDWEISEHLHWQHKNSEQSCTIPVTETISLSGKIDRVDYKKEDASYLRIIDYKTGLLPTEKSIMHGENVQLTSYSLFLDQVKEVRYIGLNDQGKINNRRYLNDEELITLREATLDRLETMLSSLNNGDAIPVWPESEKCKTCSVAGICRANVWPDTNTREKKVLN